MLHMEGIYELYFFISRSNLWANCFYIYTAREMHMVLVVFNHIVVAHLEFLGCMPSKISFIFNFVMIHTSTQFMRLQHLYLFSNTFHFMTYVFICMENSIHYTHFPLLSHYDDINEVSLAINLCIYSLIKERIIQGW